MTSPAPARPLIEAPMQLRLQSGGEKAKDRALITCPKCGAPCIIRHSQRITETVKHITALCTNSGCGHTFLSQIVFVYSYSPGLIDRPDLNLPVCPRGQVPHILPSGRGEPDDQISMFDG